MALIKPIRGIQINHSHPLARGLVGYWLFNEGTGGQVSDVSQNGHAGSWNGTGTHWAGGAHGWAGQFNGSDDYISLGDIDRFDFGSTDSFSFSAWIQTSSSAVGNWFFSTSDGGVGKAWWGIRTNAGIVAPFLDDNTDTSQPSSTGTVNDGQWHHVGFVVNRSLQRIDTYIDSVQDGADSDISAVGSLANSDGKDIGRRSGAGNFNGLISEIRIYNRGLTASEIRQLHTDPWGILQHFKIPIFIAAPPPAVAAGRLLLLGVGT